MTTTISKETLAQQLTASLLQNNGLSSQTNSSKSSSLASALSNKAGSNTTSPSSTKDVDIVTLSKEALALLEQEKLSKSSKSAADYGFTLNKKQEASIEKVLEKYKGSTMSESVWKSILADLKTAGLGIDKMTALERFKAFNPTSVMMSALFGKNSSSTSASATAASTAQAKRAQFLKQVMADWQNLKQAG